MCLVLEFDCTLSDTIDTRDQIEGGCDQVWVTEQ